MSKHKKKSKKSTPRPSRGLSSSAREYDSSHFKGQFLTDAQERELFRIVERDLEKRGHGTWDLDERLRRNRTFERDPFTGDKKYKKVDGTQAPKETRAIVARSTTEKQPDYLHVQTHQYFTDPVRTLVCHARKLRRRVLFALGLTRRGSANGRKHNFSDTSRIRCK